MFDGNKETMRRWEDAADKFDGDKALFWAGRMSMCVGSLMKSDLMSISYFMDLLNSVRHKYDNEIMKQMEEMRITKSEKTKK